VVLLDGCFEGFLHFPIDYTNKDILNLLLDRAEDYNAELIFDKQGYGIVIEDFLREIKNENYYAFTFMEMKEISRILNNAQDSIMELAIDSIFNCESKIEFLKLIEELNNLEVKLGTNGSASLNSKDTAIGRSRAICYLQYYYKYITTI